MEVAAAEEPAPAGEWLEERGAEAVYLPRLIAGVISGTLTGLFALDFIEQLLHARFVQERLGSSAHTAYRWQVGISDLGQDDVYDIFGDISSRGISRESLKKLPQFVVTDQAQVTFGENLPCTICLQVQLPE
ncbi:hypothetical protein ACQ4PT_066709 [Festuca glaucescens]